MKSTTRRTPPAKPGCDSANDLEACEAGVCGHRALWRNPEAAVPAGVYPALASCPRGARAKRLHGTCPLERHPCTFEHFIVRCRRLAGPCALSRGRWPHCVGPAGVQHVQNGHGAGSFDRAERAAARSNNLRSVCIAGYCPSLEIETKEGPLHPDSAWMKRTFIVGGVVL